MFLVIVGEINTALCAECGMRQTVEKTAAVQQISLQFTTDTSMTLLRFAVVFLRN